MKAIDGGGIAVTYAYNGEGARLKQIVNGAPTTYTLDLAAPLAQVLVAQDSSGDVRYLYGVTRIGEQQTGGWLYHLTDALGSVRQLADDSGQVQLARGYMPYGEPVWLNGTASSRYAFTGEDYDPAVGLVFLRARYMQPTLGIFLARDPWSGEATQPWTYNVFNYATDNPISLSDPSEFQSSGSGVDLFLYCLDLHTLEPLGLGFSIPFGTLGSFTPAQTAVNICRAAYSKAYWAYVPVREFDFASDLPKTAHDLFGWFVYDYRGNHTDRPYFDANQPLTLELAKTGEVDKIRAWYYGGQLAVPGAWGWIREYQFGIPQQVEAVMDLWKTMNELSVSISMFMGSFWYQVVPLDNGSRIGIRIDNDTTLSSGSHVVGRYESGGYFVKSVEQLIEREPRLANRPIAEIIRDEKYKIISILSNRTREGTGGQGGGNLYQTYYWTEEYDCNWLPNRWWTSWMHDYQVWDWSDFKSKTIEPSGWPAQ